MKETYKYEPSQQAQSTSQTEVDDEREDCVEVNLEALLQCLDIFGTSTSSSLPKSDKQAKNKPEGDNEASFRNRRPAKEPQRTGLRFAWDGQGSPLVILLEDAGIITRCELVTFEPEELLDLQFEEATRDVKLIIKADWLRDALGDLDASCEKLTFTFLPESIRDSTPASFRLEAHNASNSAETDFPFDKDVVELFECKRRVSASFIFSLVKNCLKALAVSTKTSIRTDGNLMSLQFMVPLVAAPRTADGDVENAFIEFLYIPMTDVE